MPASDPQVRRQVARIAALTRWSRQDPIVGTVQARTSFLSRFEREADPRGTLPEAERQRRAQAALRAHMLRLALASARSRRRGAAR